jgi:hypothetical protein
MGIALSMEGLVANLRDIVSGLQAVILDRTRFCNGRFFIAFISIKEAIQVPSLAKSTFRTSYSHDGKKSIFAETLAMTLFDQVQ